MSKLLTAAQMTAKYGKPGDESRLTTIVTPYPLRIAWIPEQTTSKIKCNIGIAQNLNAVLGELLAHYGYEKIKQLGIDLFGGCVNMRPKRGLEKKYAALMAAGKFEQAVELLSRHAWGTAVDFDPARNQLKEKAATARFARPEYKPMIDIYYKNNFLSYGIERDNDWMHFEIAS